MPCKSEFFAGHCVLYTGKVYSECGIRNSELRKGSALARYIRNAEDSVPYGECKRSKPARRSIRESTLRQGAELKKITHKPVGVLHEAPVFMQSDFAAFSGFRRWF